MVSKLWHICTMKYYVAIKIRLMKTLMVENLLWPTLNEKGEIENCVCAGIHIC